MRRPKCTPKCTKNPNAEREALKSTNVFLCASITQLRTLAQAKSVGALHDDHPIIVWPLVDKVFDHDHGNYMFSERSKINPQIDPDGKYIFSKINSQIDHDGKYIFSKINSQLFIMV